MHTEDKVEEKIISVNEEKIRTELSGLVRETVEQTLNKLLEHEAENLIKAKPYERSESRDGHRSGSYTRNFETKSGKVKLKIPKLKGIQFETQIIERYKRRESSVEEALIEMYLAGVSVRRIEDVTEQLWGTRVSPGTISNLNKKVYSQIEEWRNRKLEDKYPYVYLDGIYLKKIWGGEVRNISILIAIGVNSEGYREVLGSMEGAKEDKEAWYGFLRHLKERGLTGVRLIISDKCLGLVESIPDFFPSADWQRCMVHFYRNVFAKVPTSSMRETVAMLKAIHSQEDKQAALDKSKLVIDKLKAMKYNSAADIIAKGIMETLSYMNYPRTHWTRIRTNNPLERIMKEIRRRTRVIGSFPDGESALMLVTARLRHIASSQWGNKKYLDVSKLNEMNFESQ
ncbi:IS256 family transposase [Leptospira kemamanensis]|uniref:Mutator family transposase n=1 Tax=Leptospira kemamanensis TaxID=2484942 RepID=A0A4R9JQZ2_9LEPT|nr:IS256 family transposase [Leptospira kemamanensis]TGL54563.1 IS256 family transposase [Leptospira kemamanensis]